MDTKKLGLKILQNCRNELCSVFPHLDGAFACLACRPDQAIGKIATDGEELLFSPDFLIKAYGQDPAAVRRGYLHMLLHCLYLHLFWRDVYESRQWDLACDMAVEHIIEKEARRKFSLPARGNPVRERCFRLMGDRNLSAGEVYYLLDHKRFPFSNEELEAAFAFDDHSLWEPSGKNKENMEDEAKISRKRLQKKWEQAVSYASQGKQAQGRRRGQSAGAVQENVRPIRRSKYDYKQFLKRFAVPREEVELDAESFDYIFYHYGMRQYGNMPLIEPLEYKEVNRLEELAIAIDTSGSCSRETVQRFLGETYAILSEKENFFRKMQVHIIQCDCQVQDVAVIRSKEEWERYSKEIQIRGRGGTDFRPVFRYVQKLKQEKGMQNLKALIYFTDGDGVYPKCRPDYETAFAFVKETPKMDLVPSWAQRLLADGKSC